MAHVRVPEAEDILDKEFKCLDHGFIRLVDYMGGDESIVQAARVSYGKGTLGKIKDRNLIRYLMRSKHTSPFEMVELKWHVNLPIFVARQWVRHRTANINEFSLRYSKATDEFYIPEQEDVRFQSTVNKQGRGDLEVPPELQKKVLEIITMVSFNSLNEYKRMVNKGSDLFSEYDVEEETIARELARIGLGVNTYTQWYWKNDLHNTFHFLKLRTAPDAQYEIRQYANIMTGIVGKVAPMAYEAFNDYILEAENFSRLELTVLAHVIAGGDSEEVYDKVKMNKREINEFEDKLKKMDNIYSEFLG